MSEALERDTDIVAQQRTARASTTSATTIAEGVEDALTGTAFDRVEIVGAGDSLGAASAAAGANSLIIVRGNPAAGAQTIQGDQTVLGSGATIDVRGVNSGTIAAFADAGAKPTQTSTGSGLNISGDNVHIAGMNVAANGAYGIYAGNWSNTVLNQLGVSGAGGLAEGIQIAGAGGSVRILDTTIENTGDDGIEIGGSGHDVTVAGSTISNTGYGIYSSGSGHSLSLIDSAISDTTFDGLLLGGAGDQVTLSGVTLVDIGAYAIRVNDTGVSVVMNDSTLAGAIGAYGFRMAASATDLSGAGNTMAGATFGFGFCNSVQPWTGAIEFDGTTYTTADC